MKYPAVPVLCAVMVAAPLAAPAQQTPDFQQLIQALTEGANAAGQGQATAVELIDFREMKKLMPKAVGAMKRTGLSGEKTKAPFGNFSLSMAEATYRGEDGGTLTVKVTDLGAMPTIGAMTQFAWANMEIDRETEDATEVTKKIQGHRGLEKYNRRHQTGNTAIMAKGRLSFDIRARKVSKEVMQAAVKALPIEKFIDLIPGGGDDEEEEEEEEAEDPES